MVDSEKGSAADNGPQSVSGKVSGSKNKKKESSASMMSTPSVAGAPTMPDRRSRVSIGSIAKDSIDAAASKGPVIARALHGYIAETADELDFRKNDILEILSVDLSKAWWLAKRRRGGKVGYVPSNYVLLENTEVAALPGWFEIDRVEAEKRLLHPGTRQGAYILRPSSTGCYALSVRVKHRNKANYYFVHHYKLSITPEGRYCVSPEITFVSVTDLIAHYHQHASGLLCRLTEACPAVLPQPSSLASLEVNRECLNVGSLIGTGSFCEVYMAKWNNCVPVAVKVVKSDSMDSRQFLLEAELLLAAYHRHVLQIMGVCSSGQPLYLITELMPNGSLLDYLRKDNGVMLNTENLIDIMIQLADAMSHLETIRIVHRDLRAANVLVGDNNSVKLADFGLARRLDASGMFLNTEAVKFPAKWTPVEAAVKARFSFKSDVWSFGVVMWEIVTFGGTPYKGLLNREVLEFVDQGYRLPNPNDGRIYCDQNIYQVMLDCWHARPDRRPSFSRLKEILNAYIGVYRAAIRS